jgi:hypothetical protein
MRYIFYVHSCDLLEVDVQQVLNKFLLGKMFMNDNNNKRS